VNETVHGACACQCTSEERNEEPPLRIVGEGCNEGRERAEPDRAKGKTADEEECSPELKGNAEDTCCCDGDDVLRTPPPPPL
jgi:hypothetical protein